MGVIAQNIFLLGRHLAEASYSVDTYFSGDKTPKTKYQLDQIELDRGFGSVSSSVASTLRDIKVLKNLGFPLELELISGESQGSTNRVDGGLPLILASLNHLQALDKTEKVKLSAYRQSFLDGIKYVVDLYEDILRDFPQSPLSSYDAVFGLAYYVQTHDLAYMTKHEDEDEKEDAPTGQADPYSYVPHFMRVTTPVPEYLAHAKKLETYWKRLTNYGLNLAGLQEIIAKVEAGAPLNNVNQDFRALQNSISETFGRGKNPPLPFPFKADTALLTMTTFS